jgi:hypothetical protein
MQKANVLVVSKLLEPCEGRLSRTVLRGGGCCELAPLPDHVLHSAHELGIGLRRDHPLLP